MKWLMIIVIFPALCWAQEFQFRQEFDTIPVEINGWKPFAPWTGGDMETAPEFCDIDADGDYDCFIGNMGYRLTYFENIGTADSTNFKYRTRFYGGIIIDSMYAGRLDPCFVDIDADGDFDLFSSSFHGLVHYWKNIGSAQNAQFIKITDSLEQINVPGQGSVNFTDIDTDGDFDLFIGDYGGYLHFYQNVGTLQEFDFQLVASQFQDIDVGQRASPCFVDIDGDGDGDLFVGNHSGRIWFYRNDSVGGNLIFTYVSNYYNGIDVVDDAAPDFVDLDGDGDQDMAIGRNVSYTNAPVYGDIAFYQNTGTSQIPSWTMLSEELLTWDLGGDIGNAGTDIDSDGDLDIFLAMRYVHPASFSFYKNVGTSFSSNFVRITDNYQNIFVESAIPHFADINADQDPDLFIGEGVIPNPPYPGLYYYQNVGTPRNALYNYITSNLVSWNYSVIICPAFADIDADGDLDLFLSDMDGVLYFWENIGTSTQPQFANNPVLNWQGINTIWLRYISFGDIDEDGDLDLFLVNSNYNIISYYKNIGTSQTPVMQFVTNQMFGNEVELLNPSGVTYADIDADGDGDFLFSSIRGGMMFFRNVTGESPVHPDPKRPAPTHPVITLLPNPGNSSLVARYSLPVAGPVSLKVYDITGRLTGTLFYGFQLPGTYSYTWDAREKASGVYLLRLETSDQKATQKITILK
jgi:hypothetical protein